MELLISSCYYIVPHSLIVRIVADDPAARCQLGVKFGCTVSEACRMLHVAKSLNLKVVGVRLVIQGVWSVLAYGSDDY